jgi:hypothetical protein
MKNIKVRCIAFTDDCFKETTSIKLVFSTLLAHLKGSDINLVFVQNTKNCPISENFLDVFLSKNIKCKIIFCKNDRETWHIIDPLEESIIIKQNLSVEEVIEFVQVKYLISTTNTITVGATQNQFILKSRSLLHFHVGKKAHLLNKVRGLIPLTGQYEVGLLNVTSYFSQRGFKDKAVNYYDLIDFIHRTRKFYSSDTAAYEIMQKHKMAAQCLREKFPDEIVAIFGTGFPFYLLDKGEVLASPRTPNSILEYFNTQALYFSKKVLDEKLFEKDKTNKFTLSELEKINLVPGRNKFDIDKYEKMGHLPPVLEEIEQRSLEEYYSNNCFDISDDVWPCYYCSTLQNNDLFPEQIEIKDTNITCLSCKQTSFMLRNIMGCSADLDMIIVVNKDKHETAKRIKHYIIKESPYHVYDTKFYETFKENDGPIDLFVTQASDLLPSFEKLLLDNWVSTSFKSIALWSPSIEHKFQLGIDFALAFEPIFIQNTEFQQDFSIIRKHFVKKHGIKKILSDLSNASFYTEQLLSNNDLVKILISKLKKWKY